ncbi:MFS transporter [Paraburkholderia susongensis]|uniref:Metabolite-proton symporter n=1 Tax=Paraburkholderia susongensis TaxID=1515439 RepID=A0A1X7ISV8_9BURK|nr:MFS transporter [Paraburkholderia susongensis]SMG17946.1 metabolite-proton symporter [Paraburkholderia susongensis]
MQEAQVTRRSSRLKVAVAGLIGTSLEFYDHFIYGAAAALVFPKIFFPQDDPKIALILSLLTYGLAFAARPLGAALFGHFGDRIGRKLILMLTLVMMGSATFLIGVLPTYASLGRWAAGLLCLLRLLQGIALGGEWGGAALMVSETAGKSDARKGFLGSMVQVAAPIGFLLANGVFALVTNAVSDEAFLAWGWRIPFLASSLLVFVGIYIRRTIDESPEFLASQKSEPQKEERAPLAEVFRHHRGKLLVAIGSRAGSDIAFYIFSLFLQIYLVRRGLPKSLALEAAVLAAFSQILGIPLFGYLSDRIGARRLLIAGSICGALWSFVFFRMVDTGIPSLVIAASMIGLFIHAALWAPLATFLPAMFPVRVRYTGAGVGFQAAGIVGGGLAPVIATTLLNVYQTSTAVALYVAIGLLITVVAVWGGSRDATVTPAPLGDSA